MVFQQSFHIYSKVIESNYLAHAQVKEAFMRELLQLQHRAVAVLDVGCGDASLPAHLFSQPGG